MTVYTVTGLGYGDEGKGTTVDYLARQGKSLVVRHNGGPQAGHNVVTPEGRHHEFSQFGSGHFAGADTYLSKHMLVMPGDMRMEARDLEQAHLGDDNPYSRMYVDEGCKIITPYHIALNRLQAYARGESCGRGVGEAMRQDIDRPDLTIRVQDIERDVQFPGTLFAKLESQRGYLLDRSYRVSPSAWGEDTDEEKTLKGQGFGGPLSATLADSYHDWNEWINPVGGPWLSTALTEYENVIFEGAQGVLLDEWNGFHPYTTWSTTTDANALSLLWEAHYDGPATRLGITRAYATRHGAGPFVTEDPSIHYDEPHNHTGQYQGAFRTGSLDLVALRYALRVMEGLAGLGRIDGLVVTHLDRAHHWNVIHRYATNSFVVEDLNINPFPHDLKRQKLLTDQLMKTKPRYDRQTIVSTNGLLATLEKLAPIFLKSYGPTFEDKQVIVPAIL